MSFGRRLKDILHGKLLALGTAPENGDGETATEPEAHASPPPAEENHLHFWQTLELAPGASDAELKAAYRRMCRLYHPDRFAGDPAKTQVANEVLRQVNEAYQVLSQRRPKRTA